MLKAAHPQIVNTDDVHAALRLFIPPGCVTEIRALDAQTHSDRGDWTRTYSGYFNDPQRAVEALGMLRDAKGIYFTFNDANQSLLARAANRLKVSQKDSATGDTQILRRRWLLIDCDARRESGISATDDEHEKALLKSQAVDLYLHDRGWPDPVVCDSGNGAHLMYRIDLPAEDDGLVSRVLVSLGEEFDDVDVEIDQSVFNPARITRLYGTLVCKGDDIPERPHRFAKVISAPETPQIVHRELLEELAAIAPAPQQPAPRVNGHAPAGSVEPFDVPAFISRNGLDVSGPNSWKGNGRCWELNTSPMCEHGGDGPFIAQFSNGALTAGCHHNSCSWDWHQLRQRLEPKQDRSATASQESGEKSLNPFRRELEQLPLSQLCQRYPTMKPPVIDGLARAGETVNLISVSKIGKSWLAYLLAICIVMGWRWLDRFQTSRGRVLLIDNELHKETLAHRIPLVGAAMGLVPADYGDGIDILSLRGDLRSLKELASFFAGVQRGQYKAVIFDAKYRFAIEGASENDNAAETLVYNLLDQYAEQTNATLVMVHHSTKGSQSEKRVTDVGSGAGAQSRAADCHLVLREHEDEGVVVLDAAVRSFAPVEPFALRWEFPLWIPDELADTTKLKGKLTKNEERLQERDKEGCMEIVTALLRGEASKSEICRRTALSKGRCDRLLAILETNNQIKSRESVISNNKARVYSVVDDQSTTEPTTRPPAGGGGGWLPKGGADHPTTATA